MKKIFFTLALLVGSMVTYAQTDPSDNEISVEDFTIVPGYAAKFNVLLTNPTATDIAGWQLKIIVPEGFTIGTEESDYASTTRTSGYNLYCAKTSATEYDEYLVSGFSTRAMADHSGAVMTLTLYADETVEGTNTFTFHTVKASNTSAVDQDCPDGSFDVTVTERLILDENSTAPIAANSSVNVTVQRTIKGGEWNTICLPFALTQAKAQAAFGTDVQLATFTGFAAEFADEEDMSPDAVSVEFTTYTMNSRKGMITGTPYLIKTSSDITSFDVDGVNVSATETFPSVTDEFEIPGKFNGTFVKTVIPEDGLFISDNMFWYSAGKTNIKAFRGWLELGEVVGKDTNFGVKLNILVDGEETKINGINSEKSSNAVYTLDGKYVGNDMNHLRKGIYIQNGKKVVK